MRLLFCILLLAQFLFTPSLLAQNKDSFGKATDSTAIKAFERKQEFERWEDSVQAQRIKREVEKNGKPLDAFLQEMRERERVQRRQTYIRIGAGILFLAVILINVMRRRKKSQ